MGSDMTILILGATGNTGSEVVRQLKVKQVDFSVMVRTAESATALELNSDQIKLGNFDDVDSLASAMQGIESVYLAMPIHPDNKLWTENVIAAMQASGARHLVKLSGMGASEDAGSDIIRTHAITDQLVKNSGLDYTLVQPNSFYQNLYGSLDTLKKMGQLFLNMKDAKQSVVDIRDVAAVAVAAVTEAGHAGQTYLLSGPEALTVADQTKILSELSSKDLEYVAIPKDAAQQGMQDAGMPLWLAGQLAEIIDWFSLGGYAQVTDDIEKVLGRPARKFSAFATEFSELLREN